MKEKQVVRSICFECHARCGVLLEVEEGKILSIKGDKDHPFSKGFTCPKGRAVKEIVYHPERITKPIKRSGARGEGKWVEISWKEALSELARTLKEIRKNYGAEAIVFGQGTTRGIPPYINRFLTFLGSPNYMGTQNLSGHPVVAGSVFTCGISFMGNADYENSNCIILWGHNPQSSFPGLYMNAIEAALRKKAKLIVIDPRKIPLASKADIWLGVRPGTDDALALGMINVIIEKGLYDKSFVENWTVGFDKLRDHVRSFPLDRVADITWLAPELIEKAAVIFAASKPACIGPGMAGLCQNTNSFQLNRAVAIISAITGNLDIAGGNMHYPSPMKHRACYGRDFDAIRHLPPEQSRKRLGGDEFVGISHTFSPAESVWTAILEEKPYPVKGLCLFANNSRIAFANSRFVEKALRKVHFLTCVDYFHTPTTELADLVLPAAHWTERDDIEDLAMKNYIFCQAKAVEPRGECRDEKRILIELAREMGFEGYWSSVEESLDYRLEATGLSFQKFKEAGRYSIPVEYEKYKKWGKFNTPSGKVELYSETLGKSGLSPMPDYVEPPESPISKPELTKEFPFILTTGGRSIYNYHSSLRNIPSLKKNAPDPVAEIHPDTLQALGLKDGEWVWIMSPRGKMRAKVKSFEGIHPKFIHVYHGFWYGVEEGWQTVNDNILTNHQPHDPAVASTQLRGLLCRVEKGD